MSNFYIASAAAAAAAAAAISQHQLPAMHTSSSSSSSNSSATHVHHHSSSGRSRRATRASAAQLQHQKHLRALRLQKEAEESALERVVNLRREFDAARSFDFEDDDVFCPFNLMTEDDIQSISSSGSDRSSLSSGSPDHSPMAQQAQLAPTYFPPVPQISLPTPSVNISHLNVNIAQPLAQRPGHKAIPIVDPSTRTVASPPPSVSPARQLNQAQQFSHRLW